MRHKKSLLTAQTAEKMLKKRSEKDDAFAGALLRGVGKLVLLSRMPDYFEKVLTISRDSDETLHLVEQKESGIHHGAIGAYLLGLWGLPTEITEAVAHQFDPRPVGDRPFDAIDAVHIASSLVDGFVSDQELPIANHFEESWLGGLDVTFDMIEDWQQSMLRETGKRWSKVS